MYRNSLAVEVKGCDDDDDVSLYQTKKILGTVETQGLLKRFNSPQANCFKHHYAAASTSRLLFMFKNLL